MPGRSGSSPPAWALPDRRDALRPLVDRRESCRRHGRCRGRNRARPPTGTAGRSCRAACRACPSGRARVATAIWPLRTRVKRSLISAVGVPIDDGAGHVGGAVRILAARIDQIDRVHLERPVGLLAHPVMDDRAVRAGAGDRVEADGREARRPARRKRLRAASAALSSSTPPFGASISTASGGSATTPRRRAPAPRGGRRSRPGS